ncbi:hypothetical protein RIF29_28245 [Crotalaria pallida]|uniref:NPH3 domain-containing protein n=1 Tax=Crotalaria pallida TaxID=3830 RepID=A0AAN9ERD0_CROPI
MALHLPVPTSVGRFNSTTLTSPPSRKVTTFATLSQPPSDAVNWVDATSTFFDHDKRPMMLFDGVCNLCNGGVKFVRDNDRNKVVVKLYPDIVENPCLKCDVEFTIRKRVLRCCTLVNISCWSAMWLECCWFDDACILDMDYFVKTLSGIKEKGVRADLIGSIITHYASRWLHPVQLPSSPSQNSQHGYLPCYSSSSIKKEKKNARVVTIDGYEDVPPNDEQSLKKAVAYGVSSFFPHLLSEAGKMLLRRSGRAPDDISSVVLVEKDRSYIKSEAVLKIMEYIDLPFPQLALLLQFVPPFVRDFVYDNVANNHYTIFGRSESCEI